jgi:hypothetical protein
MDLEKEPLVAPETTPVDTKPLVPESKGGKTKKNKIGSRRQVFNGTAERTTGGLRKEHLMKNGRGRIVSTKRHTNMKNRIKTD